MSGLQCVSKAAIVRLSIVSTRWTIKKSLGLVLSRQVGGGIAPPALLFVLLYYYLGRNATHGIDSF